MSARLIFRNNNNNNNNNENNDNNNINAYLMSLYKMIKQDDVFLGVPLGLGKYFKYLAI